MIEKSDQLYYCDSGQDELDFYREILSYQSKSLIFLVLTGLLVYLTERWYPDFFNYPYYYIGFNTGNLAGFWPLFLYAAIMTCAFYFYRDRTPTLQDARILKWGVIISVTSGIIEEIEHRWLYICTFMMVILAINWLFSSFLGLIIGGLVIIGGLSLLLGRENIAEMLAGVSGICLGPALVYAYITGKLNPVLWLYEYITVPIANLVTLHSMENIFYGPGYPKLFVFGLISANSLFQKKHAYQGTYGYFNSWIIGFVMMYAMLTYGITTAIVIHILYDVEVMLVTYILRKIDI